MATAVNTNSGHVARALRFYNVSEIFAGIAATDSWVDDANPPSVDPTIMNLGRIYNNTYVGSTMTTGNTKVAFNTKPFLGGSAGYKVLALSNNTFEVRKLSDNTVVGTTPLTSQVAPFTSIVQGLSFTVTSSTMTAGDYFTFVADGQIGFKAVETKYMCVPDSQGTLAFRGQNYAIVNANQAYDKGARYVYLQINLLYDELPIADFRQIGIYTGLSRAVGVSNSKLNLLPSEVSDCGALEVVDNRTPIYRNVNQKDVLALILEF